jgi:heterodisulfide reductase subunit D
MTEKRGELAHIYDSLTRKFVEVCTNCGACLEACPMFPLTKFADRGAQAVMEKVTALLKGGEVSEEAYDMAYSCTRGCGYVCAKACPLGLMPIMALNLAIARIASTGREPPPRAYQHMPKTRYHFAHVFSALQIKPSEARWINELPADPKPADVVFFGGCGHGGLPQTMLDAVDILDRMGIDFVALGGGNLCCGGGHLIWGDVEAAQRATEELVSTIAAFRPKKAVFFCLGCLQVVSGIAPLFLSVPFESCELSQFLLDNLDKVPLERSVGKVVAMHDSCFLSSTPNYADVPRRLLQAIPGVTLVEMEHNALRENSICCGGVANITRPKVTEDIHRGLLNEAEAAGAEIVVTFCSGCHASLAPLEYDFPLEVRSYISLVAEAIGIHHEDTFKKHTNYGDLTKVLAEARECIDASDFALEEMERVLSDYYHLFPRIYSH